MYRSGLVARTVTILSRPGVSLIGMSTDGTLLARVRARCEPAAAKLHAVGPVHAVVAIAVVAILVRIVLLGARTFHWDEARVGYWILHTIDSGSFAYRRIIHGPVIQHINHVLVPIFGPSDALLRVPVALVGGLLPLTALLFRSHLDDDETVILALFLAFNSVLLYYSRFMRSDILVAAFMVAGLGLLVRLYDTRHARYLYGVAVLVALGFGSKENAAVYVLTWIGAAALLADQALYRPRAARNGFDLLGRTWRELDRSIAPVARWALHAVGATLLFLAVIVFLFAPRGAGSAGLHFPAVGPAAGGLGIYEALAQPAAFPAFALDVLADTWHQFMEWFTQSSDPSCNKDNVIDGWLCFLWEYLVVMRYHAAVVGLFGVAGFVWERYGRVTSRNLVLFAGYAGFVSVLGYPLGTDVFGAWIVVHAVVVLAIPAAVGIARVYRVGIASARQGDDIGWAVAAVILVVLAGLVAVPAVDGAYVQHSTESNALVQYAQPADDLDPVAGAFERSATAEHPASDIVLYYGESGTAYDDHLALVEESPPDLGDHILLGLPYCARWYNALPLPWYYRVADANVTCENETERIASLAETEAPGVVVTMAADTTVPDDRLRSAGYESATFRMRTNNYKTTVYVHERLGGIDGPSGG